MSFSSENMPKIVKKYEARRKSLKDEKDYVALQKLPRNASPVRLHNRCKITGRPKGVHKTIWAIKSYFQRNG